MILLAIIEEKVVVRSVHADSAKLRECEPEGPLKTHAKLGNRGLAA
jgi:hypothetical protein